MRRSGLLTWVLLLLLVGIPALRHASAPEFAKSSETRLEHAPRSAPGIARTAATIAAVGVETPAPIPAVLALPPAPPPAPPGRAAAPLVPLRL
jgi:hypothetical protein